MAKRKRGVGAQFEKAVRTALRAIIAAKALATGQRYRRLHRVESELATVAGRKTALRRPVRLSPFGATVRKKKDTKKA